MQQDINFYALMEKKNIWAAWLAPARLMVFYGVFLSVLTLVLLKDVWQANAASAALSTVISAENTAEVRLKELVHRGSEGGLQSALVKLGIIGQAGHLTLSAERPFQDILQGLSRAVIPGLWLTSIRISDADRTLSLGGATVSPTLMQSFLGALGHQGVFKDMSFQLDELNESASSDDKTATAMTFQVVGRGQ